MGDRDVKVVYKSREIPRDYDQDEAPRRPRIPTASDPYDHPYDAERLQRIRSWRDRDSDSTADNRSTLTTPRTVKSTYSSTDKYGERDSYLDVERSTRRVKSRESSTIRERSADRRTSRGFTNDSDRESRRSTVFEQDRERRSSGKYDSSYSSSPRRSGILAGSDRERSSGRDLEYVIDRGNRRFDDSTLRNSGPYVLDTRGEVEVIMPSRDRGSEGGRGPRYVYETDNSRKAFYYDQHVYREQETLPNGAIVLRRDDTGRRTPSAIQQRGYGGRDDVDNVSVMLRDSRISTTLADEDDRRPRTATHSSDDSYIMVSPDQTQSQSRRSAFQQKDLPPVELRRRRSRSISFRDCEVNAHEAGDKRHERPGAEARICGCYLGREPADSDVSTAHESHYSSRDKHYSRGSLDRYSRQREDSYQEPYAPQQGYAPRARSRSRRRRKDDEDDDKESYYSERVDKKYVKKTEYY